MEGKAKVMMHHALVPGVKFFTACMCSKFSHIIVQDVQIRKSKEDLIPQLFIKVRNVDHCAIYLAQSLIGVWNFLKLIIP